MVSTFNTVFKCDLLSVVSFHFSRNLRSPNSLVTVGIGCRLGNQISIPSRGSRESFSLTVLLPARVPTRPHFQSVTRAFSWGDG